MYKLLSVDNNPKVMKGNKLQDKYWSVILHLAPSNLADGKRTVCPYSKIAKCEEPCLNTAGLGGVYPSIQNARVRKTLLFLDEYETFMEQLVDDINRFIRACERKDKKPCVRLNGTSDIQWEHQLYKGKTVFEMFPSVQFYDYTKIPTRKIEGIDNYHLTWSYSEANKKYAKLFDTVPNNKAVVFRKALPSFFKGVKVIDGDTHDMRFLDEDNVVVGLKAKGKARKDYSGFVIDNLIEARAVV
jgi:hypothetical protein